jgi:Ca2+/H+ antiporter, TMEM165/GDT1 family
VNSFAISFAVVLLAELGDKSQLMALAFASRYRAWIVLTAVSLATLVLMAMAVLLGSAFALALPTSVIQVTAGLAFLAFAALTLRGGGDDEEEAAPKSGGHWAILTIAGTFFLAEFGDKTQLATMTLAAVEEPIGTWLGSTAGMVLADAVAIVVGATLGARLPERAIKLFASAAFVVFGALLLVEGTGIL